MDEYKIKLDRSVLKQLGSQLYGDTPSVIAELVANSYDADAKNVWITVDTSQNNIYVEDDGKGMTAQDINDSFLNIGYDKRDGHNVTPLGRKIMGRKGIGKLAAFSLTNTVFVYSTKSNTKCGCKLDFKRITDGEEPQAISADTITFSQDRLSADGTGTRIELHDVKKRVALSYRFIVNKLIRTFDVNDDNFSIHIRKQDSDFKELRRSELNFLTIMDTIIVIGEDQKDKLNSVMGNSIPEQYKKCITYGAYVESQKSRAKNKLKAFPYKIDVEDVQGNETTVDFSLTGWIGTVSSLPKLKELSQSFLSESGEDADQITISDNRISLFSRGKLGEYDILSKVKNNRNSEAYVIGEIYVDVFEDDTLADMAISNRRGYDEGDNRYIETAKIIKRLVGYIVDQKDAVIKRQKEDNDEKEAEEIKEKLTLTNKSKEIFENNLSEEDRSIVQEENFQFARAITSTKATKKIFISHNNKLKKYGQFIVDVLECYGIDVSKNVIFTSDRRLGVPQGKGIYDYLKECFREELMVIFIFSKAFYDSNVCISEAGAAWATNQNSLNVVVDIGFNDIEKPSNNSLSSIRFADFHDSEQKIALFEFFDTIITIGLNMPVDKSKLEKSIQEMIDCEKYSDAIINNPPLFIPSRKFLPMPICPQCRNEMKLTIKDDQTVYECSNVSCGQIMPLSIKQ